MPQLTDFDSLPDCAFVRQQQVSALTTLARPTLWRLVRDRRFPEPVRLNDSRCTVWRVGDVRQWLAAQGGAK